MTDRNPWLPHATLATTARMRLFCVPYAGGSATMFRPWTTLAPDGVQIAAIQLPGRDHRLGERPFTAADTLVPSLLDGLRDYLDRPFAIFGHSMGALIAFELTRELRRRAQPLPERLFLSAHRAPHLRDRSTPMHALEHDAFVEALRNLEGTPEEVLEHEELMAILVPTLRADFQLCETYQWIEERPLDVPLTLFGGTRDPNVSRDELEAWSSMTTGPVTTQMFEGGHLFLQHAHEELMNAIQKCEAGTG